MLVLPFPRFIPADDERMSWLVADIVDHFYEPLADVVHQAAAVGRLNIRVVGDQVSRLDTQPTFGEREALLAAKLFRDGRKPPAEDAHAHSYGIAAWGQCVDHRCLQALCALSGG